MAKLSYLVAMVLVAMALVVVFTGFFFSSRGRFLLFVAFKHELITFSVVVDVVGWQPTVTVARLVADWVLCCAFEVGQAYCADTTYKKRIHATSCIQDFPGLEGGQSQGGEEGERQPIIRKMFPWQLQTLSSQFRPAADPKFPGGRQPQEVGRQHIIRLNFPENCLKMKKIRPRNLTATAYV